MCASDIFFVIYGLYSFGRIQRRAKEDECWYETMGINCYHYSSSLFACSVNPSGANLLLGGPVYPRKCFLSPKLFQGTVFVPNSVKCAVCPFKLLTASCASTVHCVSPFRRVNRYTEHGAAGVMALRGRPVAAAVRPIHPAACDTATTTCLAAPPKWCVPMASTARRHRS